MDRSHALAACLLSLAIPMAAHGQLERRVDADGVVHISNDGGSNSVEQWVDARGVTHPSKAPSDRAIKQAGKESITPKATGKRSKVRETRLYDDAISRASDRYRIPHALLRAIIIAESNFNPRAISRAGARGLMQLMPGTARDMHVRDAFNPAENIEGGARYLRILANSFQGDVTKAVAAYNAGPEPVKRHKGIPPYAETRSYVKRVMHFYGLYRDQ